MRNLAQLTRPVVLSTHVGGVRAVTVSPDGWMVIAGVDALAGRRVRGWRRAARVRDHNQQSGDARVTMSAEPFNPRSWKR